MGINFVQEQAKQNEVSLLEQVFGGEHFRKYHDDGQEYKPKFLRTFKFGRSFAFPNGLPGGWNKRKIHLIAHS